jgi:hypothetical protein
MIAHPTENQKPADAGRAPVRADGDFGQVNRVLAKSLLASIVKSVSKSNLGGNSNCLQRI